MDDTKDVDYYLGLPYRLIFEPESENGYVVSVVELPGCISQGDSLVDAHRMIEDAKRAWIAAALEDGKPIPEPGQFSGKILLRVPSSLHRDLVEIAQVEGVSLNQWIGIELGRAVGRRK